MPYSPEYRAAGTDEQFLETLARRSGGRLINEPDQAFVHDLPAVGAPRPLWPYLLVLVAILFVADVGVRRVRITGPEMRAAYYTVRRRLGYVDEPVADARPATSSVPVNFGLVNTSTSSKSATEAPPAPLTRQGRLLAAKHRANRR